MQMIWASTPTASTAPGCPMPIGGLHRIDTAQAAWGNMEWRSCTTPSSFCCATRTTAIRWLGALLGLLSDVLAAHHAISPRILVQETPELFEIQNPPAADVSSQE